MKSRYIRACWLATGLIFLTACLGEEEVESKPDYPRPVKLMQIQIGDSQKE